MLDDDRVLVERTGNPAITHGQRLPTEIDHALAAAGVTIDGIGLLAVIAGPGSFTGLRVGIASMQGLAFARGLRIVPVSALDAVAAQARTLHGDAMVGAWIDAHRGEVFAALYEGTPPVEVTTPTSAPPESVLAHWEDVARGRPLLLAGDGAVRYADRITTALGDRAAILSPAPPLAAEAGRIAAAHPERAVAPDAIVPIYVRRPDAELARDRAAGQ